MWIIWNRSVCKAVTSQQQAQIFFLHESYQHFKSFFFFSAYRHVGFAASVHGFSHWVDQVAADAKVAHLHLALSVDQHVGGLHIYDKETPRQREVFCATTVQMLVCLWRPQSHSRGCAAVTGKDQLCDFILVTYNLSKWLHGASMQHEPHSGHSRATEVWHRKFLPFYDHNCDCKPTAHWQRIMNG